MEMDKKSKEIIDRLRKLRIESKLSQLDLSLKAGISQSFLAQIETYKKAPTIITIVKICDALNIRVSMLFDEKDYDKEVKKSEIIDLINKYL